MIRAILTVCRKEILDNVRDRRTMLSTLAFGPLFAPIMFAVMINITVDRAISSEQEQIEVPTIGIDAAGNLQVFLAARNIETRTKHDFTDIETAAAAVSRGDVPYALIVEASYAEDFSSERPARVTLVFDRSDSHDADRAQRIMNALSAYSDRIGMLRLLARGISPTVTRPVLVDAYDVSTPVGRSAMVLGILTYFLLFAVLMGGMYLAIDTTAGERERRSLEPLLTTPVSRTSLLLGKVSATVVFMLISLALTLVGFMVALRYLPLDQLGMSSGFDAGTALAAFLVLAPFALLGAFLLTLVASFTRSYKEAQTWLGLLMIVPTLPVALATLFNVRPTQALMWVPSMSQHLLITGFIKQESVAPGMLAQSVLSTLLYAFVLALISIRLYKREALLG